MLYILPVVTEKQSNGVSLLNTCPVIQNTSTPIPAQMLTPIPLSGWSCRVSEKAGPGVYIRENPWESPVNAIGDFQKGNAIVFDTISEDGKWLKIAPNQIDGKGLHWYYQKYVGWVSLDFLVCNNYNNYMMPTEIITPTPEG